ncbi:MAG: hypothetical protein IKS01_04215 [Paludibacteraceae bacterium]|nr:hypothetical protein [Paludibacteraceae bacterium]
MRIINAELRYYMHIQDPDSLSDEEWAREFKNLEYLRRLEASANPNATTPNY